MSDCNQIIKLKRGLASEWQTLNLALQLGEPGYEKDTKKLKIGDGVTPWNNLPYIGEGTTNFEDIQDEIADLLKAGSNIILNYDDINNALTISTTGLQPSGDYSVVGHSHSVSDIIDFNNSFSELISVVNISQGSGILVSENNKDFTITSDITYISGIVQDSFNTGLVAGSGIDFSYDEVNETLTIGTTGLQPSGNYSLVGHTHTSADITDFNSSVSGLIPVQQLVGVSGISVSSSGTTRQITSNFIPGNGIAFNYNNDESLIISTITNNGIIPINNNSTTSLTIPGGYVIGSLSIYQNGVKLLDDIDYIANNGSNITFTNIPTSGSYIEYGSPTFSSSIQNLINIVYDTSIYDLGNVSGSVNIDYSIDKQIQTLTLNGTTVTLNKGSGWPTTNISRDVVLQITCNSATTIVWNIVENNWYNKPTSILPGEEYLILLRSIGSSVIQGHYIGNKQGSL